MNNSPTPDYADIARRYIATFNETDADARRGLLNELYAADCRYVDPIADASGVDEIDAFLAATQQQFAGIRFSLGGPVDGHRGQLRLHWHAVPPAAQEPVAIGFDVLVLDEHERVRRVYGFLDRAPAG
jgi:SnoaL-like domain